MSRDNVEVVLAVVASWQRNDFESFLSATDPNIEWHTVLERLVEGPDSVYRGHDGIRRLWQFYRTELENFEIEVQELRDVGDDRVLFLGRFRWWGVASGIESESPLGAVITVRDGKIVQSIDYVSHQEAIEAAGLGGSDVVGEHRDRKTPL
jgi:ketosteroid isomerase-like protein